MFKEQYNKLYERALHGRSEVYKVVGKYADSISDLQNLIEIFLLQKKSGIHIGAIEIEIANIIEMNIGNLKKAECLVKKVLKKIENRKQSRAYQNGLSTLARILMDKCRYSKALELFSII